MAQILKRMPWKLFHMRTKHRIDKETKIWRSIRSNHQGFRRSITSLLFRIISQMTREVAFQVLVVGKRAKLLGRILCLIKTLFKPKSFAWLAVKALTSQKCQSEPITLNLRLLKALKVLCTQRITDPLTLLKGSCRILLRRRMRKIRSRVLYSSPKLTWQEL